MLLYSQGPIACLDWVSVPKPKLIIAILLHPIVVSSRSVSSIVCCIHESVWFVFAFILSACLRGVFYTCTKSQTKITISKIIAWRKYASGQSINSIRWWSASWWTFFFPFNFHTNFNSRYDPLFSTESFEERVVGVKGMDLGMLSYNSPNAQFEWMFFFLASISSPFTQFCWIILWYTLQFIFGCMLRKKNENTSISSMEYIEWASLSVT